MRRLDSLDALRGMAIVWMTLFHFCFDLNHFGYLKQDFYTDPFWTWQRNAIVSLFLFTAGLGQAVAVQQGQNWSRFWRRWRWVVGGALLVSVGSWMMYPRSFIYFGVLHGMALMLLIVRLVAVGGYAAWGRWLGFFGIIILGLQFLAPWVHAVWPKLDFLNEPGFNSLGLISRKPVTEDYVPLVPWLGVMLWGVACGTWLWQQRPHWLAFNIGVAGRPLAWLGRWSLFYYLIHQPLFIGFLQIVKLLDK